MPGDLCPREGTERFMNETKPPTMEIIPVTTANLVVCLNLAQG